MTARRLELTRWASAGFTALAAAAFLGMLVLFAAESAEIWRTAPGGYLLGTTWFYRAHRFGILPMVYGTLAVSAVALAAAIPVSLGAAVCTAELLPGRWRLAAKLLIELLSGIPSVVYGLLGILLLRRPVERLLAPWDPVSGDTLLTGGLLLGVMILPTVTTLADDALRGVPAAERLAGRALGLTRSEVILGICVRRAFPGLASAALLGLGRALGETVAVFLVIGRQDNQWPESLLSFAPLAQAGQTITSKLGGSEPFQAYGDPLHWAAIVGLALVLFVLVGAVSAAGARLALGKRDG